MFAKPYWGKVVGALAGLATGRPWMAIVGLLLGHQFDRGFAQYFDRVGPDASAEKLGNLPGQFVQALFQTMGHLAKSDGRVSQDEIRAARSLMHRLGLGPAEARRAIDWFESGKSPGFPLRTTLRDFRKQSAKRQESRALFVRLLLEVSLSKPRLQSTERTALWTVCSELGIGRVEFAQLEAMLRAQKGFRHSTAGDADARRVDAAYETLGVSLDASNDEIKTAYRRLMNRNHPDKLAGKKTDAATVSEAERRTREIRSAYEMLKVRRSIR